MFFPRSQLPEAPGRANVRAKAAGGVEEAAGHSDHGAAAGAALPAADAGALRLGELPAGAGGKEGRQLRGE